MVLKGEAKRNDHPKRIILRVKNIILQFICNKQICPLKYSGIFIAIFCSIEFVVLGKGSPIPFKDRILSG